MSDVKNQHYVPQSYLKRFADHRDRLSVFDKFTRKSFQTHVKNIASETHFYDFHQDIQKDFQNQVASRGERDIDAETVAKAGDPQLVEHELAAIEADFCAFLDDVLRMIDQQNRIAHEQKRTMAYFMAIQLLRTPEFRRTLIELEEATFTWALQKTQAEDEDELYIEFNEKYASLEHAQMLFSPNIQNAIVQALSNHIWVVGINETSSPFYTSDTPIVRRAHRKDPFVSYAGLASPGIEIMFPLTPRYILCLWDKTDREHLGQLDGTSLTLPLDSIVSCNHLQVLQSYRQVYSPVNDFRFAEQICIEHPEVCTSDRVRVEVDSTKQPPDRKGKTR
jgi:Protein of unknown function (DUF4238)